MRTDLPLPRYEPDKRAPSHPASSSEVRALPGVTSAATSARLPMVMRGGIWRDHAEGHPTGAGRRAHGEPPLRDARVLRDARNPARAGRDVARGRHGGSCRSRSSASRSSSRYWPGRTRSAGVPFGRWRRTIKDVRPFQDRTIVGVVGDVRSAASSAEASRRSTSRTAAGRGLDHRVHAQGPRGPVAAAIPRRSCPVPRRIVATADPQLAHLRRPDARRHRGRRDGAAAGPGARALGGFAALAFLLAGIGIHGLLAFTVAQPLAGDRRAHRARRAGRGHPAPGPAARRAARRDRRRPGPGLAYAAGRACRRCWPA